MKAGAWEMFECGGARPACQGWYWGHAEVQQNERRALIIQS